MPRALFRMYQSEFITAWAVIFVFSIFTLAGPAIVMQEMIRYATGDYTLGVGLALAFGMMIR